MLIDRACKFTRKIVCSYPLNPVNVLSFIVFHPIEFSDADVRLTRRIRRDTIEKGRDIKTVLDQVTWSHTFLLTRAVFI
jgi:uridine kinase